MSTYVERLRKLEPLVKPHIPWASKLAIQSQGISNELFCEITRVVGAISVDIRWLTPASVKGVLEIINETGAALCAVMSPYHLTLPDGQVDTFQDDLDEVWSEGAKNQLYEAIHYMKRARNMFGRQFDRILLICERYRQRNITPEQDRVRSIRHHIIECAARQFLGPQPRGPYNPPIIWYSNAAGQGGVGDRWGWSSHFTPTETRPLLCPEAYYPRERDKILETLYHTVRLDPMERRIWPKIAIGAEYVVANRNSDDPRYFFTRFSEFASIRVYYSWWLGRMLGWSRAPRYFGEKYKESLSRVDGICLYPEIDETRSSSILHLLAYVQGTHGNHENWKGEFV